MSGPAIVPSRQDSHYLPTLDGWRAIAIAMVILSHCLTASSAHDGGGGVINLLTFRLGTFGVMLFFAISGFLISTRLLIEEETAGSISLRSFYIRRVFRILPPAYAYLAVVSVLALAGVLVASRTDIAAAAFFAGNYFVSQSWFTGHFWSLAIEEHFYLIWPPILAALGRRRALWIAAALVPVTVLLRHLAMAGASPGADLPGYTHLRLDAFMFPAILAILLRDVRWSGRFTRAMTPLLWCSVVLVLGIGIAVGTVVPAWREPQRLLQATALPVIVVTTVVRPGDWLGQQLRRPVIEWLGRRSYSVYLWQQMVFGFAPAAFRSRILALLVLVCLILVIAELSYRWIEQPMISWGRRLAAPNLPL